MKINKSMLLIGLIFLSMNTPAQTNGTLTFTAKTLNQGGTYSPKNIMAVWVTNSSGVFVKTLKKMAIQRVQYLNQWKTNSASNVTDAITGATLSSHQTHTVTWNCKNVNQEIVADGDYKIWIEFTEGDYAGPYAAFTWTKGPTSQTLTPTNPAFSGISINWTASPSRIPKVEKTCNLSVFPNPFKNQLYFVAENSTDPITVDIYDITGRKVAFLEENPSSSNSNIITWNGTSNNGEQLKSGVYFYNITFGDKKYAGKVILSK